MRGRDEDRRSGGSDPWILRRLQRRHHFARLRELFAGLGTYLVGIGILAWIMFQIPDDQAVLRVHVGGIGNGLAGLAGLIVAWSLRIRSFRAFGFRSASAKWLGIGAVLGVIAFGASFIVEGIYFHFITEPNTQGDFQAAAMAGTLSLAVLLVTGAIITPLGEELVFRGVVANALNRYGAIAGIVLSAAIFGIAHGPSVILFVAFMVGIPTGYLFRRTESLWPGVVTHIVYNGMHSIDYSTP